MTPEQKEQYQKELLEILQQTTFPNSLCTHPTLLRERHIYGLDAVRDCLLLSGMIPSAYIQGVFRSLKKRGTGV